MRYSDRDNESREYISESDTFAPISEHKADVSYDMSLKYSKLRCKSLTNQNDLSKVYHQQGMNTVYHKETIKVLKSQTCTQQYVKSTTYSSVKNQNVIIKFRKIKWKELES